MPVLIAGTSASSKKGCDMLHATPVLLNAPVLVMPETVPPWFAVLFFGLMAGLPRLLSWLLKAPRR
jgi:hypothetical protein